MPQGLWRLVEFRLTWIVNGVIWAVKSILLAFLYRDWNVHCRLNAWQRQFANWISTCAAWCSRDCPYTYVREAVETCSNIWFNVCPVLGSSQSLKCLHAEATILKLVTVASMLKGRRKGREWKSIERGCKEGKWTVEGSFCPHFLLLVC